MLYCEYVDELVIFLGASCFTSSLRVLWGIQVGKPFHFYVKTKALSSQPAFHIPPFSSPTYHHCGRLSWRTLQNSTWTSSLDHTWNEVLHSPISSARILLYLFQVLVFSQDQWRNSLQHGARDETLRKNPPESNELVDKLEFVHRIHLSFG